MRIDQRWDKAKNVSQKPVKAKTKSVKPERPKPARVLVATSVMPRNSFDLAAQRRGLSEAG